MWSAATARIRPEGWLKMRFKWTCLPNALMVFCCLLRFASASKRAHAGARAVSFKYYTARTGFEPSTTTLHCLARCLAKGALLCVREAPQPAQHQTVSLPAPFSNPRSQISNRPLRPLCPFRPLRPCKSVSVHVPKKTSGASENVAL